MPSMSYLQLLCLQQQDGSGEEESSESGEDGSGKMESGESGEEDGRGD